MVEIDNGEDAPINSLHNQVLEDHDPSDETQDFRFLASLTSKSGATIPKRGEKDFEPHGTRHQDGVLAASRQAMHEALDHTRFHTPKNHIRAFYYGSESLERDEAIEEQWRKGLDDDHVVVVENSKGPHFKTMGKSTLGKKDTRLWLLPEEALYLVERGNLDLWWPTVSSFTSIMRESADAEEEQGEDSKIEQDDGLPMSLQAAYAMLTGRDGERGKITLEKYSVYANLRRTGYVVLRPSDADQTLQGDVVSPSIFSMLFGRFFAEAPIEHSTYGPLVKGGLYRSYSSVYQQLAIIPRHTPVLSAKIASPVIDPFCVVFHIWKPTRIPNFSKKNPGMPDFRIAIVDAHSTSVPTLMQITSLLESTPFDPPPPELQGPSKNYQRLKHGWRNVVLGVVDQGVVSYLRLGEGAFGQEKIYNRFDRTNFVGGPKRGGGGGRGRGGGNGRGRGGGKNR